MASTLGFVGRVGRAPVARIFLFGSALATVGCLPLTREEAQAALEEAQLYAQAATLIGNSVELSSNFSIGGAVEDAAQNLRAFYESQMPCAELTVEANQLTVDFGVKSGSCVFRGMTFSGSHQITITTPAAGEVLVEHEWTDLSNQIMVVNGSAEVTWKLSDDAHRRIVHDLHWKRLSDAREASGSGDRTQRPLDGDLETGIVESGEAEWQGESGNWSLSADEVEMRWVDPIPQGGEYVLATPFDKSVTFSLDRTSATNVRAKATSGSREYEVDVKTPE